MIDDISDLKSRTVNPLENDSSLGTSSEFNQRGSVGDRELDDIDPGVAMASHNIGMDFMKEKTYDWGIIPNISPNINNRAKMDKD